MGSFKDLFPLPNSPLLILSLLLGIYSIILSYRKNYNMALGCLITAGFVLRLFMAHVDPYLHEWDERFHALVARNMSDDPFRPVLVPAGWLDYNYTQWPWNHIWLHKQPLFLWQMALSIKIFGATPYAIRYPAVIMQTIGIWMIYRLAFIATAKQQVGFIAALLVCFSAYPLELLSGYKGMDQNDAAFIFYILASIWSYAEYTEKKTVKYALLVGLFAGCAVFTKWLTGMLVFSGWAVNILLGVKKGHLKQDILHFLLAVAVSAAVFVPWLLYIFHAFPREASHELAYNAEHITHVLEGHDGDGWFYIERFGLYFGFYICWLLPVGIVIAITRYRRPMTVPLIVYFVIFLSFFSFVVKTKMYSYVMPATTVGYVFIAICIGQLLEQRLVAKFLYIPALLVAAFLVLSLADITANHDLRNRSNEVYAAKAENTKIYRNIHKYLPPNVQVLMNVQDYVDVMYYNPGLSAFAWYLSEENIRRAKERHAAVALYPHGPEKQDVPAYITGYDSLYTIDLPLK